MNPLTYLFLSAALGSGPALSVDPPAVDRGELPAHKPLTQTFQLKNNGSESMTLTDVASACGCLRHKFEKQELRPGESTELTVGVGLLAHPEGPAVWAFRVQYKIGESAGNVPVKIVAKVRKDVTVEPAALMLSAEGEVSGTLTVLDRRKNPLKVTAVRLGLKDLSAEVKAAAESDGRRATPIAITLAAACPVGQHVDEICIDTDDPEYRELRVPLRVLKKAPSDGVQAAPANVTLRFAKDQPTATSLVKLRDAKDGEVTIEKAEADHAAVSCKFAAGPGSMATLRVTVDRAKANGSGVAVVRVKLSGPKAETILVPVSWHVP